FAIAGMAVEGAGRRELTQLVPDHVLRDVYWNELAPVVDREGVAHHLRRDGGAPRPGADDALLARIVQRVDLLHQMALDYRPLFDWPGRASPPSPRRLTM